MWPTWLAGLVASVVLQVASGELRPEERSSLHNATLLQRTPLSRDSCENARLKCAYRSGCGQALQNYMMGCSFMLDSGPAVLNYCPEPCQHALIALTSTEEGKNLMNCRCTDESCEEQKRRVEVCRPQVEEATRDGADVACIVAEWICAADPLCSTALEFYHRLCKAMFQGKKCNHRCNNSLSILLRQEKAAKLATCRCDGRENYDCQRMRDNMSRLCLHKLPSTPLPPPSLDTNEVFSAATPNVPPCWTLLTAAVLLARLLSRSLLAQDT
ncbi:growth arrest-specific protein 1-like [Neocloeon triangulifer]|uniref:growth arrest-specific protein 1-like n=1 Tax=Neocloeon triangulifer TaxID=2078957 RepID=UPI00286EFB9A|nr:growth arrest-specific protein 1-like [Neocloeon triangulifer]